MGNETDPAAQGQPPAAEGAGNTSQEQGANQAPGQHEGFQKRIDQLTAERRAAEQREEMLRAQLAELTNSVIQRAQQAEAPQTPPVEITPEEKAKYDYVTAPLQRQLEELKQQNAAQLGQLRFQQAIAGKDPRVVQRAQQLLAAWQKDPSKGGWTPEDALVYASGELGIPIVQQQPRDERGRFNGGGGMLTQHSPAPIVNGNQNAGQEPDWNTTSPEKLAEFYEKRLAGKVF